jgi:hypothetical protein
MVGRQSLKLLGPTLLFKPQALFGRLAADCRTGAAEAADIQ